MVGDEHHPSPPKLLDHAEAVIEHHREADDHGADAPADDPVAAEHDLIEYCRKYRPVVLDVGLSDRGITFRRDAGYVAVYGPHLGEHRFIDLDEPTDRPAGDR
jgi:hypothetical protein